MKTLLASLLVAFVMTGVTSAHGKKDCAAMCKASAAKTKTEAACIDKASGKCAGKDEAACMKACHPKKTKKTEKKS